MGKVYGETRELYLTSNVRKKTDTGKTIQNGSVNLADAGVFAGWEEVTDGLATMSRNTPNGYNLGDNNGTYETTLLSSDLPEHRHELSTGTHNSTAETLLDGIHDHDPGSFKTTTDGDHTHNWTNGFPSGFDNQSVDSGGGAVVASNDFATTIQTAGNHSHNITGKSDDSDPHSHNLKGFTGSGESSVSNVTQINNVQPTLVVLRLRYIGFTEMFNHVNTLSTIF